MKKKIVIYYFPAWFRFLSPIFFVAAVYCLRVGYLAWGIILIAMPIVVLTTRYITMVDLDAKRCSDFLSFVGLALDQEIIDFKTLDRIIVTKGKYSQPVKSRVQDRQLVWADYTATLMMDDDKMLTLLTTNGKEELFKGLKEFSEFLRVDVEDRTMGEFYWVDMSKV